MAADLILLSVWLFPLIALAACMAVPGVRLQGIVSSVGALLSFLASAVILVHCVNIHPMAVIPHWIGLNAFGSVVLIIETFGAFTATLFAVGSITAHPSTDAAKRSFWIWFNLFIISLFAIPLLQEIAMVWLALTLTTLFSVFLVSFDSDTAAFEAGWKYALMTTLGAAVAVLGILMLYWAMAQAGSTDFSWAGLAAVAPKLPPAILNLAFLLILVGLGAKAALIPFHAWLPDAYSRAPFPICAMLSILESAAIPYVLLQLAMITGQTPHSTANQWLLLFGLVSAGGAALLMIQTHEYKRLFAYSTIENAGIILAAGAAATVQTRSAAVWQMVAHGISKPLIFYACGGMFLMTNQLRLADIRGLLSRTRSGGVVLMIAGLAIAGAPPFALFLSELAVLKSTIESPRPWIGILLAFFMIISFCAITYHLFRMVLGPPAEISYEGVRRRAPRLCAAAVIISAIPVIVLGWYIPRPIARNIGTVGTAGFFGHPSHVAGVVGRARP
ncbi:MAG: proton-conducting transporter membrane subunit [Phycisphaerae bacterium]